MRFQSKTNEQADNPTDHMLLGCVSDGEVNIFRLMRRTMCVFDTDDRRDNREGGWEAVDRHTHACQWGASCVTSADRNKRRACGGGCALFFSILSESAHSHTYD